jgi:hypothetical protein
MDGCVQWLVRSPIRRSGTRSFYRAGREATHRRSPASKRLEKSVNSDGPCGRSEHPLDFHPPGLFNKQYSREGGRPQPARCCERAAFWRLSTPVTNSAFSGFRTPFAMPRSTKWAASTTQYKQEPRSAKKVSPMKSSFLRCFRTPHLLRCDNFEKSCVSRAISVAEKNLLAHGKKREIAAFEKHK